MILINPTGVYATSNFTFLAELGDYIMSSGQLQLHSVFIVIICNQILELHHRGIPNTANIPDVEFVPNPLDCVYCCESIWALTGILWGFRPMLSSPTPRVVDNYPNTEAAEAFIGRDIKSEY